LVDFFNFKFIYKQLVYIKAGHKYKWFCYCVSHSVDCLYIVLNEYNIYIIVLCSHRSAVATNSPKGSFKKTRKDKIYKKEKEKEP